MTCGCRELEDQHGGGECKCAHYSERFPDCMCERKSVSEHSPGIVCNDEVLVRAIFNLNWINRKTERLNDSYFRNDKGARRGWSVNRTSYIDTDKLRDRMMTDEKYKGYLGFISVECGRVRALTHDDQRLFCIYDTAIQEDPSHADICQAVFIPKGTENRKHKMLRISRRLQDEFGHVEQVNAT